MKRLGRARSENEKSFKISGRTSIYTKSSKNVSSNLLDIPILENDPSFEGSSFEVMAPNVWYNSFEGVLKFRNAGGDVFILEQGVAPEEPPPTGVTSDSSDYYYYGGSESEEEVLWLNLIDVISGSPSCGDILLGGDCENAWDGNIETETYFLNDSGSPQLAWCRYDFVEPVRVDRLRIYHTENSNGNYFVLEAYNETNSTWDTMRCDGDLEFYGWLNHWLEFDIVPDSIYSTLLYSDWRIKVFDDYLPDGEYARIGEIQLLTRNLQFSETNVATTSYGTLIGWPEPCSNINDILDGDDETCSCANEFEGYEGPAYFQFTFDEPRRIGKFVFHGLMGNSSGSPYGYFQLEGYDPDTSSWDVLVYRIVSSSGANSKVEVYHEKYYSKYKVTLSETWMKIDCCSWEMYEIVE